MNMSSLVEWITILPTVLDEVTSPENTKAISAFVKTWKRIVGPSGEGIKESARIGVEFDKWLEVREDDEAYEYYREGEYGTEPLSVFTDDDLLYQAQNILSCYPRYDANVIRAIRTVLYGLKKWKYDDNDTCDGRASDCRRRWVADQSSLRDTTSS